MSLEIGDCSSKYIDFENVKKEDVDNLSKWCEMQRFLPKMTEMQIINFLHSNNFIIEQAKLCIDNFFTLKTNCPAFFTKRNPNELDLNVILNFPFEQKSPEGFRIIMFRLMDNNPNKFIFTETIKIIDMTTMLILNKEGPAEGQIFIYDLTGITLSHLAKLNLWHLKKFFYYLQECMPLKIKAMHFINIGNIMDKIMFLIRPFMKKELLDVLYTHQAMESIYKMIPKEYFPKDFPGGLAPSFEEQLRDQKECLLRDVQFFREDEKQVIDEQLRPKIPGIFSTLKGYFTS